MTEEFETITKYKIDGSRARENEVSKTELKREVAAVKDLGEELTLLSKDQLAQVPMSDKLEAAIKEYKRLNAHGALRRQMQFIGKIMRTEDIEPIKLKLDTFNGVSAEATAKLHRIERLRLQLIENDDILTKFSTDYPHADVQSIRTLVRNTRKEAETGKPPKAFRELFQAIRDVLEGKKEHQDAD